MNETNRVSAIWEVSADTNSHQSGAFYRRQKGQQPSFNFAPFFTEACEEVGERKVSTPAPVARMQLSSISTMMRLQRA